MARIKNRIQLVCPNCSKKFEIVKSRLNKSAVHYCSILCLSKFTAKQRSLKMSKRKYPFRCGKCLQCGGDILAKSASFVKPNRKFCSMGCRTRYLNLTNNPMKMEETRKKVSIINRIVLKGKKRSEETKEKNRKANLGNKSHFWKGGLTNKNRLLRNMAKTKDWRKAVFERDNYTCQMCGSRNGNGSNVKLSAHHIKDWATNPESRWDVENGQTLCWPCHRKTDNFGHKVYTKGLVQ